MSETQDQRDLRLLRGWKYDNTTRKMDPLYHVKQAEKQRRYRNRLKVRVKEALAASGNTLAESHNTAVANAKQSVPETVDPTHAEQQPQAKTIAQHEHCLMRLAKQRQYDRGNRKKDPLYHEKQALKQKRYRERNKAALDGNECPLRARLKQQEERIQKAILAAGWSEWHHPEVMPPKKHFKREKRIDFRCVDHAQRDTWCRIDFVLAVNGGYVFLEVDENQHQFGYDANLSCDMKRMAKVMTSLTVEAGDALPHIYWLRYNPHAWHVDGATLSLTKTERERWLCTFLSELALDKPLRIGYAFYDSSEGKLDVLANEEYHREFAEVAVDLSH